MCFHLKIFAKTEMSGYLMERQVLKEGFSFVTMTTGYHPYAHWRTAEANVVCRQLGFAPFGSTVYRDNRYGVGNGTDQYWLTSVVCNGYKSELQFCLHLINATFIMQTTQ